MSSLLVLLISIAVILTLLVIIIAVGKKYNGANWGHPATNVLDGWLRLYCNKFHRMEGQKIDIPNVPKLILAANHLSAIDPFLLITATDRPIRFMIAKEEYQRPILKWMFKAAGCIPVDRGGRVEGAFRTALRAINAGELVAIFPQGGIHSDQTPRTRIKSGIVKLSELTKCSILPVRIRGIAAPGTMVKCVINRSRVSFDVNWLLNYEQVQSSTFKLAMSEWLIEKKETIEL